MDFFSGLRQRDIGSIWPSPVSEFRTMASPLGFRFLDGTSAFGRAVFMVLVNSSDISNIFAKSSFSSAK